MLYLRRKSYKSANLDERKNILGFIDDEEGLRKRTIHGYTVHGSWNNFVEVVESLSPTEIILTCELPEERLKKLTSFCAARSIKLSEWVVAENVIVDDSSGVEGRSQRVA